LRGKGIRSVHNSRIGDLLCRILVETPVHLSPHQKELLREFERSTKNSDEKHNPQSRSWLDGVKKFFEDMKS
jgi:molecular chaperone DnaJ